MKKLYTVKELSSILGISVSLVYRKLKKHNIEPLNPDEVQSSKAQKLYSNTVIDVLRPQQSSNNVIPPKEEKKTLESSSEDYIKKSDHYRVLLENEQKRITELRHDLEKEKELLEIQTTYTNKLLTEQQNTIKEQNETNQRSQALLMEQMEINKRLQEQIKLLEQKPRKKFLGLF